MISQRVVSDFALELRNWSLDFGTRETGESRNLVRNVVDYFLHDRSSLLLAKIPTMEKIILIKGVLLSVAYP